MNETKPQISEVKDIFNQDGETKVQRIKNLEAIINRLIIDIKRACFVNRQPKLENWRIVANENNEIAVSRNPDGTDRLTYVFQADEITSQVKKVTRIVQSEDPALIFQKLQSMFGKPPKDRF